MKFGTLFKQKKNNTYSYTPRYYDERKERLDNLKKKYEVETNENSNVGNAKKSYRDEWLKDRKSTTEKNTRLRLIIILICLFLFTYIGLRFLNLDKLF